MPNLEILNASQCNIDNNSLLKCTNLVGLNIGFTQKITDLNHLTKLKMLNLINSNVGNGGIAKCTKLVELDISHNQKITHLVNFKKLQYLNAWYCKMTVENIKKYPNLIMCRSQCQNIGRYKRPKKLQHYKLDIVVNTYF